MLKTALFFVPFCMVLVKINAVCTIKDRSQGFLQCERSNLNEILNQLRNPTQIIISKTICSVISRPIFSKVRLYNRLWPIEALNYESINLNLLNDLSQLAINTAINNIRRLSIKDSTIEDVPEQFLSFSRIQILKMESKIIELHSASFNNLNLTFLDLSSNQIHAIPLDLFGELGHLRLLNLSYNILGNPTLDTFYGLTGVTTLDLSSNRMTFIQLGALDMMTMVRTMDLSNNALVQIDLNTFDQNKQLNLLNLRRNLLREIKLGTFDQLSELIWLDLSGNKLREIPFGLFDRTPMLNYLDLSSNQIRNFPLGIFDGLKSIKYLYISNNRIGSFELGIFDAPKGLINLDLSGCDLNDLQLGIFDQLKQLKSLNLSRNHFEDINQYLFDQNVLETLDVSYNSLNTEPSFVKPSMTKVFLNNNRIPFLSSKLFSSDTFFAEFIDIRYNDLSFLPIGFFNSLVNLKTFDIGGNPWECACMEILIQTMNQRFIGYSKRHFFDGRFPSCIVGASDFCQFKTTYDLKDKNEFLEYFI